MENWRVAFTALQDEYESLFFFEKHVLYPIITAENMDVFEATNTQIDRQSKKWQDYLEKGNKKYEEREKWAREDEKAYGLKIVRDPWYPKWLAMKNSRLARQDPAFQSAIDYHLSRYS